MTYKDLVKQIRDLHWGRLNERDLQGLMVLSGHSALEFASSLKLALQAHPENEGLQQMAAEELQTTNLSYADYGQTGDHANFLWYFIDNNDLRYGRNDLMRAGRDYTEKIQSLKPEVRVMSIVSREQELPGIFTRILTAPHWQAKGLPAFRYYLERHIELDSAEEGHAAMLKDMPVDERVAAFYEARLALYRCLPALF